MATDAFLSMTYPDASTVRISVTLPKDDSYKRFCGFRNMDAPLATMRRSTTIKDLPDGRVSVRVSVGGKEIFSRTYGKSPKTSGE